MEHAPDTHAPTGEAGGRVWNIVMKRKSSTQKAVLKRYKTIRPRMNANVSGETKFFLTAMNSSVVPNYKTLTNITTGGEYDRRIGNKVFIKNIRWTAALRLSSTYNLYRIMIVQSRQGMLAGADGVTDSPGAFGLVDSNKYRLLHDELVTGQAALSVSGVAINTPFTIAQGNVQVNRLIKYKQQSGSNYECDQPIYFWCMPIANDTLTGPDIFQGSATVYYNDV